MDIVEELRRDREKGARRLEAEYKAGLMSLARRFGVNDSDAEELVNSTFATVVENIDDYIEQSAFFAWMCQILTSKYSRSIRRKSTQMEVFPGTVPDLVDESAQEALACRIIYEATGEDVWKSRFDDFAQTINDHYWDDEDGAYYDIASSPPHHKVRVLTPASFWPLLAGVVPTDRARRLVAHLENAEELGGIVPFPSVSRKSRHFSPDGRYWRGGVWLPTAYMCVQALEGAGFGELADRLGEAVVRHQFETWRRHDPHTIWECYSPTEPKPSTGKFPDRAGNKGARPDFCGWSALGPINMMIENVLGICCDGVRRRIDWHLHRRDRHGVRRLSFGGVTANLIFDGGRIEVETDEPFTLCVNGASHDVPHGRIVLCASASSC